MKKFLSSIKRNNVIVTSTVIFLIIRFAGGTSNPPYADIWYYLGFLITQVIISMIIGFILVAIYTGIKLLVTRN